jgi:uncharacterized iron-regulated protein
MNMMFSKFLQDRVCFRGLLVLLLMLLIPACAQIQPKDKPLPLLLKDHPLAGKIYDVKQGRFIEQDTLPDKLRQARYILLGETHDNIAHHLGEQWALNQLAETKRAAGSIIAFEMIDEDQGKYLAETRYTSVDELIGLLHHVSDQWGYDTYYRPVFEAALRAKFTIVPASPSRENIIKIVREGKQGISPDVLALMEKTDLGKEQTEASHKEIEMSHCGMSNEKMVEAMMRTQRAKDAFMTI